MEPGLTARAAPSNPRLLALLGERAAEERQEAARMLRVRYVYATEIPWAAATNRPCERRLYYRVYADGHVEHHSAS